MSRTQQLHADMVASLSKPGELIREQLHGTDCHLMHMAMGVAGEAGELLDAIKKSVIYRKPLDLDNVIEELGDLEFYMQGIRAALEITREKTLQQNLSKLGVRYSKGYSDTQAQDRADKKQAAESVA